MCVYEFVVIYTQNASGFCLSLLQVFDKLKQVNFTQNNYHISFDTNGDPVATYELVNWQLQGDGSIDFVTVGQYDASQPKGQEFSLSRAIIWNDGKETVYNVLLCFYVIVNICECCVYLSPAGACVCVQ